MWAKIKNVKDKSAFFVAAIQAWCAVDAFMEKDWTEGFAWGALVFSTIMARHVFLNWFDLNRKYLKSLIRHSEDLDKMLDLQRKYIELQARLKVANQKLKTLMFVFNENASTKESTEKESK